jgi:thioredoxin 1
MAEVELNQQNFDQEVMNSSEPVLIDFWAEWCGPCKVLSPLVEQLSEEYQGKLKVGKVNVDENNDLAMRYNVMSIPTLKFFKNGQIVGEIVGAAPRPTIEAEIKKHL